MRTALAASFAAFGALAVAWTRPFRVEVTGPSMEPSLFAGDYLVATRKGGIRRGALVVVERPGHSGFELVKRVTGLPGELVDGRLLQSDEYWLVGETTDRSTDSRTFGPVTKTDIRGVVRLRYWPPCRIAWFRVNR